MPTIDLKHWPAYETLALSEVSDHVLSVELNRPKKMNAMSLLMWDEIRDCFGKLKTNTDVRVVVVTGAGKMFTSGLDLRDATTVLAPDRPDPARSAFQLRALIANMQESFTVIDRCPQPVIAAVHSACIGGGVDLITACDIRMCSADAVFSIKEVDIGLAADVGTLQRLPKVVSSHSWVKELAYTARDFRAEEALRQGFVSHVLSDREALLAKAHALAKTIANKSPVAVYGSKQILNYARDNGVAASLDYQSVWNAAMLQTQDVVECLTATSEKRVPIFSKL